MLIAAMFRRALAWLRRNPHARADALELAAAAARTRAEERERQGRGAAAGRLRARADLFDARARQLRGRA